jgi:hypothetical protein
LAGRARRWQCCARGFDSCRLHQHPKSLESVARLFTLLNPSTGAAGMKTQPEWEIFRGSLGATRKPIRKRFRQYPRTKVSLPVIVFPRRQPIRGKTVDLSLTGASILLPELPDLTCPVELFIEIPNMYVVPVVAAIVRFHLRPVGDESCHHYGLAVHFSNISDEDRRALSCVLARRQLRTISRIRSIPTLE